MVPERVPVTPRRREIGAKSRHVQEQEKRGERADRGERWRSQVFIRPSSSKSAELAGALGDVAEEDLARRAALALRCADASPKRPSEKAPRRVIRKPRAGFARQSGP